MFPNRSSSQSLQTKSRLHFGVAFLLVLLAIHLTVLVASRAQVWWDATEARLGGLSELYEVPMRPHFGTLLSFWDVGILMSTLVVFVFALPPTGGGSMLDCRRRSIQQRLLQFRIRSILIVTAAVAIICAIARGCSLHPLLLIVGALYACGPWTALLVGNAARIWYPASERQAIVAALAILVFIATGYAIASSAIQHPHAIPLRDLVRITAVIWCPQVMLYLALRRWLLPDYAAQISPMP